MSNQTPKTRWPHRLGRAWARCREAGIPWLAMGVAAGALLGVGAGSLAWGLGVGAAIGLVLQRVYGRTEPARG